ncbi:MAG: hypothetical protein OXI24_09555 [Candidatus Poribacteria bacterium]|nr:hypothetical protein [Candidatus Poribacteria bacterium]
MQILKIMGLLSCLVIVVCSGILVYIEQKRQKLSSPDHIVNTPLTEGSGFLPQNQRSEIVKKLETKDSRESLDPSKESLADYDWQQDEAHLAEKALSTDPWAEYFQTQQGEELNAEDSDTHETNPYPNWPDATDPYERTEGKRWSLIRQFGDIPEVHIVADIEFKMRSKLPYTIDEKISFLEALNTLWPNTSTQRGLAEAKAWKASGKPFIPVMKFDKPRDQFLDVKPFVERYGWDESIRQFRKITHGGLLSLNV